MADKTGGILATIKDLITRTKGLDEIYDAIGGISISPSDASTTTTGVIVEDATTVDGSSHDVPSPASSDTFSSWVEIDASLSDDSFLCSFDIHNETALSGGYAPLCVEIGIGSAGSEITIIHVTLNGMADEFNILYNLPLPIKLVSGTRISARTGDGNGSIVHYNFSVQYYQGIE